MNGETTSSKQDGVAWATLFASTGTLACCALPIILVALGLGTTVVAMTSMFPFLITLSLYKTWVFAFSGLMLTLSGWLLFRPARACPADSKLELTCNRTQLWKMTILAESASASIFNGDGSNS